MPDISIIVPIFQAEHFIDRCVMSILGQSYKDLEILLIDDGSTDGSAERCDYFASTDDRVHVIHQKNAGVSSARNTGLCLAKGEYITFVDSDDWIEPTMYEEMMNIACTYACDIIMCDCIKEKRSHSEVYTHDIRSGFYDYDQIKKEYYPHLLMMENADPPPTISNYLCLFHRKLLYVETVASKQMEIHEKSDKIVLKYLEGVRNCEDLLFGAEMMLRATSFYYLKGRIYYHYSLQNLQSASHVLPFDVWNDFIKLHNEAEDVFLKVDGYDFRHQVDLLLLYLVYIAVNNMRRRSDASYQERKKMLATILREPKVQKMFHRIHILRLPLELKLKIYTIMLKYQVGIRYLLSKG